MCSVEKRQEVSGRVWEALGRVWEALGSVGKCVGRVEKPMESKWEAFGSICTACYKQGRHIRQSVMTGPPLH